MNMLLLQLYKTKFDLIISCIIEILLLLVTGALTKKKSFSNYPSFVINASLYQHTGMLFDIILISACNNYKLSQLILSNSCVINVDFRL